MTRLQGCGTALVTPFTDRGDVDYPALRALAEWQIAEGIDFLVPCGSTGEAQTLDDSERERVVAAVIETAAGRVPVMAGASSNDTARATADGKKLFGSITNADVASAIKAAGGPSLDKNTVDVGGHIKTAGSHPVSVKLHPGVAANFKVTVVTSD